MRNIHFLVAQEIVCQDYFLLITRNSKSKHFSKNLGIWVSLNYKRITTTSSYESKPSFINIAHVIRFFVSEYTKLDKKHCYPDRYGNYSSIQSAKIACLSDGNCKGVYDNGCNGKASGIHLCPTSATYSNSFGSCIYQKNENSK